MFTDRDEEEVLRFFEEFSVPHFATAGIVSPEEVLLPAGDLPYQHTMEVFLRELEMPVSLVNGGLHFTPHTCTAVTRVHTHT